jgi:(E)-4-hydroxy-3-methylbut-2-enyl-diphosphate synthase
MISRRKTRQISVADVKIGGDAPISVQSMTTPKTEDVEAVVAEINRLEEVGCEIVRITVPDDKAADGFAEIRRRVKVPLVADIHFNYRMALRAIEAGADKIRINPGNIGSVERVGAVLKSAKERGIPIRIGVNSGSVERELLEKYGYPSPEAMVESAIRNVEICQDFGFDDIVISVKASDVTTMIQCYQMLSEKVDFPLHLGVTEAGLKEKGSIKSSIGIGTLLYQGIGDTIRVSLTEDPVDEVKIGFEILKSLGLRNYGVNVVACPTCGRIEVDLISIVSKVEEQLEKYKEKNLTVSILGCAVNGPGEAREADIGLAFGKGSALVYKKGVKERMIHEDEVIDYLVDELENWPENNC